MSVCPLGMGWGCSLLPLPPSPNGLQLPVSAEAAGLCGWRGFGWLLGLSVAVAAGSRFRLPRVEVLVADPHISPLWAPVGRAGWAEHLGSERTHVVLGFPPLQNAGSRGEQARQLVIDLETRGKQAFPIFLSILRDTEQGDLADMLIEECECQLVPPQVVDLRPVELDLHREKHNKNVNFPERLSVPVQAESERPRTPPVPARGKPCPRLFQRDGVPDACLQRGVGWEEGIRQGGINVNSRRNGCNISLWSAER